MNKFIIVACADLSKEEENYGIDYEGMVVVMASEGNPELMLFFPVSTDQAKIIDYVLKHDKEPYDINTNTLGIYKTMLDSWRASEKYLAGIVMDIGYNVESKEEIMTVSFALSNTDGFLDGMVQVSFIHAVLISVLEKMEILISDRMLEKIVPDEDGEMKKPNQFPENKEVLDMVKKIMSAKIKED